MVILCIIRTEVVLAVLAKVVMEEVMVVMEEATVATAYLARIVALVMEGTVCRIAKV